MPRKGLSTLSVLAGSSLFTRLEDGRCHAVMRKAINGC